MKKLLSLFSFLALFSLIFFGCQSTDDINSPVEDLDKPAVYNFGCDPTQISDETVDLVAGQHNPVGTATFHLTASGNLVITYQLDADEIAGGAVITEVHIDFARALNNNSNNGGFHANKSGNPQPGQFDINKTPSSGATSWTYTVPKADLVKYLNLPVGSVVPPDFYIAAHGVVEWGGEGLCPTLPNGKFRYLENLPGPNYYIENVKLYDQDDVTSNLFLSGLNGWCIDRDRGGRDNSWYPELIQVNFVCSNANDITCFVDIQENMGAVNWLINNKNFAGTANMAEIQIAVWRLIDDLGYSKPYSQNWTYNLDRINDLVTEALNHNTFVPDCGQLVGVIMYEAGMENNCASTDYMQVMLIERTVACGGSDTMWGFDWDFDNEMALGNYSCRFVEPGNWARYFKF